MFQLQVRVRKSSQSWRQLQTSTQPQFPCCLDVTMHHAPCTVGRDGTGRERTRRISTPTPNRSHRCVMCHVTTWLENQTWSVYCTGDVQQEQDDIVQIRHRIRTSHVQYLWSSHHMIIPSDCLHSLAPLCISGLYHPGLLASICCLA